MADSNIPAYPFMFSADQFANKYSPFAGKPLPPTQYYGTPTDAQGRPIQSYLDAQAAHDAWAAANPPQAPPVTLNTNPQDMMAQRNAALTGVPGAQQAYGANFAPTGSPAGIQAMYGRNFAAFTPQAGAGARPAAAAPAQPQNPIDMNQAYLNALANPGHVTTPGATVPQAPTPTGQSGVLQQFLANWQNKGSPTTGAGNYNNAPFFAALQGQV